MSELGFDSAAMMRLVGVERETSFVSGHAYLVPGYHPDLWGYWGYWGYGWNSLQRAAGYLRADRIIKIANNVYSVGEDKLAWASESETFNPASLRSAIAAPPPLQDSARRGDKGGKL